MKKIEDYRLGYPRYAALISAHTPFFVCRRFGTLRARILLLKQDRLSVLEEKLEQIDRDERCPLFLGKSRIDKNADRIALMEEIEKSMDDYDKFTENSRRMLNSESAEERDVESLQNWLDGNACLARQESAYLKIAQDIVSLAPCKDNAMSQLEVWVENRLIRFYQSFRNDPKHDLSIDPNVYLYSGHLIRRIARAFLLVLITILLLLPVVICNLISDTSIRIVIIMFSTIIYLSILSGLTRSRTMELVLAGATYTTVLIVFVSGSNGM